MEVDLTLNSFQGFAAFLANRRLLKGNISFVCYCCGKTCSLDRTCLRFSVSYLHSLTEEIMNVYNCLQKSPSSFMVAKVRHGNRNTPFGFLTGLDIQSGNESSMTWGKWNSIDKSNTPLILSVIPNDQMANDWPSIIKHCIQLNIFKLIKCNDLANLSRKMNRLTFSAFFTMK